MNKFFIISLLLVLALSIAEAQSFKIQRPKNSKTTRAVIVGISDYEDLQIPDLRFAHKDAEAFANYLRSGSGGSISEDNIKVYLNEEATGGNIHKALYWLLKESKKNDNCIIYFSGHGDVETIYEDEPGHFLVYDSPSSIYQINSLRLDDLKRIISTLSKKTQAKVTVYTDACRSGKLAGSEVNGTQATAAALTNQFANEVKIMSCQANEFSVEGEQWGGGRGLFSYHLIEGLTGLADTDNNLEVDLKEIQRYLEDRFEEELTESRQTPVTVGNKQSRLSLVDPIQLEKLKIEKDPNSVADMASVDLSAGSKNNNTDQLIELFYKSIETEYLLTSFKDAQISDSEKSAEYYFDQIVLDPKFSSKIPIVKGDFIAALQNDAQHAINQYLDLNVEVMQKRWHGKDDQFDAFPVYLSKAAELLGEEHYMFAQIKSKELYFKTVANRIKLDREKSKNDVYLTLIEDLNKALIYQPRSSFILNEKGVLYLRSKNYDKAIEEFKRTIEMSPTWAMPYNNISYTYNKMKLYDLGIEYAEKALLYNDKIDSPYTNLSRAFEGKKDYKKSIEYDVKHLQINPKHCLSYNKIGYKYSLLTDSLTAIHQYDLCIACDETMYLPYVNKSKILYAQKKYKAANDVLFEYINLGLSSNDVYTQLAYNFEFQKDYKNSIKYYKKVLEIDKNDDSRYYMAILMNEEGQFIESAKHFEYYIKNVKSKKSKSINALFHLAVSYAKQNKLADFQSTMKEAIKLGFNNTQKMEENNMLSSIRSSQEYNSILNQLNK